ncbi:MAG: fused MFS/spermidine synthase [Patescibacteria group bacterium]
MNIWRKYNLEIVVFISGACVMILELVGSRVLAPYAGSSLSTWTSLIGIILGCLSLGYWIGGKIADKSQSYDVLALMLLSSGLLIGVTGATKGYILNTMSLTLGLETVTFTIISSIILFGIPSLILGVISPYAVRLKIKQVSSSGSTVGNLYAISTFGSILGTFIGGFYLIPNLGNSKLIFLLAAIMAFNSLLVVGRRRFIFFAVVPIILITGIFFNRQSDQNIIVDVDSTFQRIQIISDIDRLSGRSVYSLKTDAGSLQSEVFADGSDELVFDYTKFYRLSADANPQIKNALMIGGGAFSYPRDFLKGFEKSSIDVVEIDPMMTELAKKFLFLKDDPRLKIYHEDGRVFLNKNMKKYDVIYLDAFKSLSPPVQLTTKECIQKASESLNSQGFIMANVISSLQGEKSKFLWAEYMTFKEVFPYVAVFQVNKELGLELAQNLMLVGFKDPQQLKQSLDNDYYRSSIYNGEMGESPVLTDDFSPTDFYLNEIIS